MINATVATSVLQRWCQKRGVERGVREFLAFLKKRHSLYVLPGVLQILHSEEKKERRTSRLCYQAGQPTRKDQLTALRAALGASDTQVSEEVREELRAGAAVEYQNKRIEASVEGRLSALRNTLTI